MVTSLPFLMLQGYPNFWFYPNKLFRKRNYSGNCARFFFHVETPPTFSALFGHGVGNHRALAAEEDVEESKPGVAEIKVEETTKLVGLLEDLSRRLKKLETATTSERKRNKGRGRVNNNYTPTPTFAPNVQASGFVQNQPSNCINVQQNICPHAPPPQTPQDNVVQPTDTATTQVCY